MLCAMFVSGALLIQVRGPENPAAWDLVSFSNGDEVWVTGHVTKEGTWQKKEFGEEWQRIDVEIEQITYQANPVQIHAGLRLSIFSKNEDERFNGATSASPRPSFRYGERLRFPVKLALPRNFRNPGAFDYVSYLAGNGITVLGSVKIGDVEVLPGFYGNRFELWRSRLHRSLIEKIHVLWPYEQAALIDTIMLGDETFLGRETRTNFQRTGTYHVLVVSGLKIGILALVMFWLLRRLRVNEFVASTVTVGVTISYALLTDADTSSVARDADAHTLPGDEAALS